MLGVTGELAPGFARGADAFGKFSTGAAGNLNSLAKASFSFVERFEGKIDMFAVEIGPHYFRKIELGISSLPQ